MPRIKTPFLPFSRIQKVQNYHLRTAIPFSSLSDGSTERRKGSQNVLEALDRQATPARLSSYVSLLCDCGNRKALAEARGVHAHIMHRGFRLDLHFENRLIVMYNKCHSVMDAHRVFARMATRNLVSWNAMIDCYARHGHPSKAFQLFGQMQQESVEPDKVTFLSILKGCTTVEARAYGKLIHAHVISQQLESDIALGNALLNMYGRCRSIDEAWNLFDRLRERNVVTWNIMIAACAQQGYSKKAFKLFQYMQYEDIKPDGISFINILNTCNSLEALAAGKLLHAHVAGRELEEDVVVGTALLNMYEKCGSLDDACRVFNKLPEKNVFSWNVMIGGYASRGQETEAFQCFKRMQLEGIKTDKVSCICILSTYATEEALPWGKLIHAHIIDQKFDKDVIIGNAIVNMYCKCGGIEDARKMFDKMLTHDVISWTVMLDGYARHGESKEAFKLFQQMQSEGVKPDKVAFIGILNACDDPEDLELRKIVHTCIIERGFESDIVVATALLNMYGKCGDIKHAQEVFDHIPERNVVSWNAMIAIYGQHGSVAEPFGILNQMNHEGIKPDAITFVNILHVCSHAGLVDEGMRMFNSMDKQYYITPTVEHHNCIVDLLGRAGRLNEAEQFIKKMPVKPDFVTWITFLGACRLHGCINRGEYAAKHALQLEPEVSASYVVLSNIYATAGMWADVTKVRSLMEDVEL